MAKFDIVVVGSGNAGLSAAVQCALLGKKTLLIEQHNVPGGCASSFCRGRFEFDPSVHEICDYGPEDNKGDVRLLLEDLGVHLDWVNIEDCYRCVGKYSDGTPMDVTMPTGEKAFIDKMEEYVPGSRSSMETMFELMVEMRDALVYMNAGGNDSKLMQEKYPNVLRTSAYPVNKVFKALKIPQKAIDILTVYWTYLGADLDHMQFLHYANMIHMYVTRIGVIPQHTSHQISMEFMRRFYELGGTAWFNCRAEEFLFDGDRCCGVKTTMGTVECDYVLANINQDIIYGKMMPKHLIPEREKKLSAARNRNFGARMFVAYFGLNRTAEELGIKDYCVFFPQYIDSVKEKQTMEKIDTNYYSIFVCNSIPIPNFSPKGTCVLNFTTMFGPDDWNKLEIEDYNKVKNMIAKRCITTLKEKLGVDIEPHIEEMEIATPWTFARYLGTPEGCVYGYVAEDWDPMLARMMMLDKEFPIKGLSHIGASGPRSDGYSQTWLSGSITAKLAVEALQKGVK